MSAVRSARPPVLLVLAVLLVHLGLSDTVSRLQEGWRQSDESPARMKVAFVRQIELQPPPSRLRPATPAARGHRARVLTDPAQEPAPLRPETLERPEPVQPEISPELPVGPVADRAEPGPEWPLSTRLEYALVGRYQGPIHGQAQVEWLRKGAEYQMHLEVSVGPSFAPLMTRRSSSYGRLTAEGIRPDRYEEETKALIGEKRRAVVQFNNGYVVLSNYVGEPMLPGAQDQVSQFVHLTWLFLTGRQVPQPGLVIDQALVLARRQYPGQYRVLDQEQVDTPMGALAAWHVRPTRQLGSGDFTVEFWSAPSVQYLPVKLRLEQSADVWIELTLKDRPLQAAPEPESPSSSVKASP